MRKILVIATLLFFSYRFADREFLYPVEMLILFFAVVLSLILRSALLNLFYRVKKAHKRRPNSGQPF